MVVNKAIYSDSILSGGNYVAKIEIYESFYRDVIPLVDLKIAYADYQHSRSKDSLWRKARRIIGAEQKPAHVMALELVIMERESEMKRAASPSEHIKSSPNYHPEHLERYATIAPLPM